MSNAAEELREQCEQRMDEIIERGFRRSNAQDVLYHYTNSDGFTGILQQRGLRLTEFRAFRRKEGGDANELQHADAIVREAAHSLAKEFERDLDCARAIAGLLGCKDIEIYVGCFSSAHDNAYLWEKYAGLDGYCLGFDMSGDEPTAELEGYTSGLIDVEYDEKRHFERVQASFREALNDYPIARRALFSTPYRGRMNLYSPLLRIAARANLGFKAVSFSEEREVRLVASNELETSPDPVPWILHPLRSQNRPAVLRSVHVGSAAGRAACDDAELFLSELGYGGEGMPPMPLIESRHVVPVSGADDREQ